MDRWAGKVALVTGASVGIGAQISKALAEKGMKVIAVARRLDKLEELAASIKREFKTDIYTMVCDVRKEEDILKVFKWANDKLGGVDVLINNAGVLKNEPIIDGSTENYRMIMDVNVIAIAICSREFVRSIKKRKTCGHIVNINSLAGHFAESILLPLSVYCASKYAVTGMSHSLRNEIANEQLKIKVTSLSPGAVDTDMLRDNSGLTSSMMEKMGVLRDKDIADGVIYVLSAPPNVVISELTICPQGRPLSASMSQ
ncbi:farnesol dehydrogenase-like [Odontomachus brunneus]|uniref:farnesol dehydrogenase-like n=1 Tax=Odontomachus brunneus TaxID=486640 RepID=UPI0013F198C1|nr:farnesol dehydrogenase-like [Odontomachus brunneus]